MLRLLVLLLLQHGEAALALAGVSDFSARHFDATRRSDPRAAFHLQLSGHTHGGQFLPWISW